VDQIPHVVVVAHKLVDIVQHAAAVIILAHTILVSIVVVKDIICITVTQQTQIIMHSIARYLLEGHVVVVAIVALHITVHQIKLFRIQIIFLILN
jgi:hypothetical protein